MKRRHRLLVGLTAAFGRLRHGITLGVRAAAIDEDERIFLVRHRHLPGWYFPGGGVETGESAAAAVIRELAEEAGLSAEAPELFGLYLNPGLSHRDHVAMFVCRRWTRRAQPYPNLEIADGGFFDRRRLPEGVTDATVRRLAEIFDGRERSAEW